MQIDSTKIAFMDMDKSLLPQSHIFNGIIATIFANRLAEHQIPIYHSFYDKLVSQHNSNLHISFT